MSEAEDVDGDVDQPELEDDELADFGAVAEQIEEDSSPNQEDGDDVQEESDDSVDEMPVDAGGLDARDVSIGTIYCNSLGMGAAVVRAQYGSADEEDREQLLEDYSAMAEDLQIDEYVDEWLEEHGGIDQLSPGQAILVSTMLWSSFVVMDDPTILEGLGQEVGE